MLTTDPERALVGALLNLPADAAVRALALVHDGDLADPRVQVVAQVARQVAGAGIAPDPVAVLAHSRSTGVVTRADTIQNFTVLIGELYAGCPTPGSARYYAVATLEEAVRRRCAELAARIEQAAEAESLESLVELVDREAQAVRELAARRAVVADDHPARLRAVIA